MLATVEALLSFVLSFAIVMSLVSLLPFPLIKKGSSRDGNGRWAVVLG